MCYMEVTYFEILQHLLKREAFKCCIQVFKPNVVLCAANSRFVIAHYTVFPKAPADKSLASCSVNCVTFVRL